jgi:glyoxylase-like metal-dependent hydrolase (beta-lactamase superfamily II)
MVAPDLWRTTEPAVHDFFRANAFTVTGRDADLQVDFLCGFMPLRPVVQSPGKPLIAVATHAHVDHVGGFHEFADRRGPAREAAGFATMAEAWTLQGELRDQREGPAFDRPPHPGFRLSDWALVPAPLTVALDEGDVIDLGDRRFTVLHLPGHSPGSIGLLEERTGLFLSGDAVYDDRLVDDVPGASVPDYLATMDRLRHLDIAIGHGGHGPPFSRSRLVEIAETYMRSKD